MNADNEEKVQLETLREDIETVSIFLFTIYHCLVHCSLQKCSFTDFIFLIKLGYFCSLHFWRGKH